jgi:hypothetical protein
MKIEPAQQITSQTHTPVLSTIRQFSEKYPAFSQGSLRNLIHLSAERYSSKGKIPSNGLAIALVRIGRKLLIDEVRFFQWIEAQQGDAKCR